MSSTNQGGDDTTTGQSPAIDVSDISIRWNVEDGVCTFAGLPVAMMWVSSTLAGLMAGVQKMVGTERFGLALQAEGRKSVDEDWQVISQFEDFREGFAAIANIAAVAGWGRWELVELDEAERRCIFRVRDSWEALYQQTLDVQWGSAMLAGKLAGYCSRLFETNCWAEQVEFLADSAEYDEFVVRPSDRSLEAEIEGLLASGEATKADMAVALEKLRKEVGERLHAEAALRHARDDLEIRVADRTAELARMNAQLQQDISERRKAQEALRESEDRFRRMAEASPLPMAIMDSMGGTPEYFNPRFVELFGWELSEIPTVRAWMEKVYPDPELRARVIAAGEKMSNSAPPWSRDYRVTCRNGDVRDITWRVAPLDTVRHLVVAEDTTERRMIEAEQAALTEKLHRSRKMEAVGLLAGGVAHDLNNILSGITSYPDLLLDMIADDDKLHEPLKTIRDSGIRAAAVVQDLLTIARGAVSVRELTDLNDIVNDYLLSAEFKTLAASHPGVIITTELEPDLLMVSSSPVHARKLIMNMVANAAEAIEVEGTIVITTQNKYLDLPLKGYDQIDIGEYVVLSIQDDGEGIGEENIERIFEPFYSKKILKRSGTGLGLAVVWNTVQDHDGYINVTSSPSGSRFDIYLPATRERIEAEGVDLSTDSYRGQGQHILVIDDEETQRQIACKMLERLGYRADDASSGAEALELLEHHPADLLVLDMIMPNGWSGRQTYEKILERWPRQRAVIASGYAETEEVRDAQRLGAGAFLKKPYTLQELGLALRNELNRQWEKKE